MSKFIGLNIARLDDNDQIYRTGSVLLNVEHIVSIESHGPPRKDSLCRIQTVNDPDPFIVEGSMIDLLDVIKRAGADFHAFDNKKTVSKKADLSVLSLFARLKYKYETMYDIGRALKENHPDFYTTDHINGIAQRLSRLQTTHDNLDSYPQKREVLEHLKQLDEKIKGLEVLDFTQEKQQ
jgi:hypothetical protein